MLAKSIYYLFIFKLLFLIVISDEIVPKVRIAQGEMQGKVMTNLLGGEFFGFQGIPYAKPPIGSLRFKSPEPAEPWTGILNATQEGADCFQMTLFPEGYFKGSEDCLFLNVYTPKLPEKSNEPLKPVMVLLHGGGYIFGNGGTTLYGPEFLLTQDIVYVGFNYRLNVFGFLSFEDPTIGVPGNAGLKDMVQALKWIQANIASFGGDPNKVTIFGESAGGASVAFMLLSPSAKGLFHRAISQSGVATVPWVLNDRQYQFLAENLKYPGKNFSDQQSIFEFLNNTSGEELIRAQLALDDHPSRSMGQYGQVGPVVENPESNPDAFLTDHPETILKSGPINQVPYILGFLRDEGALFLLYTKFIEPNFTDSNLLVPKFINVTRGTPENKEIGDKIKQFYYGDTTPSYENIKPFIEMTTDIAFSHKIVQTAKRLLERMTEPIYFYYFQYKTDMNYMSEIIPFPVDIPYPIVVHADDNGYLFPFSYGPIDVEPDSVEMRGIHRMVKFWTNFARTGNPNTMDNDPLLDVKWPAASLDQFNYLNLQDNLTVEPLSNLIPERLAFWDALDK